MAATASGQAVVSGSAALRASCASADVPANAVLARHAKMIPAGPLMRMVSPFRLRLTVAANHTFGVKGGASSLPPSRGDRISVSRRAYLRTLAVDAVPVSAGR